MIIFPKDFPDRLKSQILVSEIVGKKVKLKSRGKDFIGLCPFHNEKSPSFTVNDLKGFYHCFGCQAHGDIVSFTMHNEGLDFREAVIKLANDHNIEIPQVKSDFRQNEQQQTALERNYLILEKICEFFENNFKEAVGSKARQYAASRGLSSEIIKKFRLGYAPSSYDALHKYLLGKGFGENEIVKTGVIAKNDQQKLYDKFRNRLIFPIFDKKNRVIAFGGRVLDSADFPKYLNSSETEFFKKNQTLYNYSYARKAIFDKKYAVITEGYMDVISVYANGIENVVAGLGTALSENHFKELFAITDKIVICLDGDSAGVRAAKRASEIALPLINSKKTICFTFLPGELDPDDFIKTYGVAEFEKNLLNATTLSQALLEFALIDLDLNNKTNLSAEDKAKIQMNLDAKIAIIKDTTLKKYFDQFFKESLYSLGRNFVKGKNSKNSKNDQNIAISSSFIKKNYAKPTNSAENIAKNIIALIVKFPLLAHYKDENFDIKEVNFLSADLTDFKDRILNLIEENEGFDEKNLLLALEKSDESPYIKDISNLLQNMSHFDMVQDGEDNDLLINKKMNLLLLKELLLQVEEQYKQSLLKIEEIETYQTTIINQKIKEIFAYKNSLEQKILDLERDLIN